MTTMNIDIPSRLAAALTEYHQKQGDSFTIEQTLAVLALWKLQDLGFYKSDIPIKLDD